jgi:hypothetical protein
MEYSPNYPLDIVTRPEILAEIANSTEEYYIIEDIILGIETNAKQAILDDKTCNIPYLGTFMHNNMDCFFANAAKIREAKTRLDPVRFIQYKRELLGDAVRQKEWNRRVKANASGNINRFPKLYKTLCKEKGEFGAYIYMAMMPTEKKLLARGESMIVL